MFDLLPTSTTEFMRFTWPEIEPYFEELAGRPLDGGNLAAWMSDWTRLHDLIAEWYARLNVATTQDTTDAEAETRYHSFLDQVYQPAQAADQRLKQKLLASGLEPGGFSIPLRKMQVEAGLFRAENLPFLSEERKLASQYNQVIGAQTVLWEGEELTLQKLRLVGQSPDRALRERAWKAAANRQLADRQAINALWQRFMPLRCRLAENAGLPDFRAYRWGQMLRLDYSPENCLEFQQAIEQVAVPAATRVYARHREQLGLERLRPWDVDQDLYPVHQPALSPYGDVEDLQSKAGQVFELVDPQLGVYYRTIQQAGNLDLANRKGKAPGAYCTGYPVARLPFVFMNAVGLSGDVRTILHECGHAFHNFERMKLPYAQQRNPGLEFAEVASMAMELLASPYLACDGNGAELAGFYTPAEARRFRAEHLEHILTFWPYMAVVDAFQHWVYTHAEQALDPTACDACWLDLWNRFIPGVDWSGLEQEAMTGWQRKQHIFRYPFYYVEYGLAQLGAVLVWRNALQDQAGAVASYRAALALGGTASLPELYRTAGASFAFDAQTLGTAVELVESQLAELLI